MFLFCILFDECIDLSFHLSERSSNYLHRFISISWERHSSSAVQLNAGTFITVDLDNAVFGGGLVDVVVVTCMEVVFWLRGGNSADSNARLTLCVVQVCGGLVIITSLIISILV